MGGGEGGGKEMKTNETERKKEIVIYFVECKPK